MFNIITPLIDNLLPIGSKLQNRIEHTYDELLSYANKSPYREEVMKCIQEKKYAKFEPPVRKLLSRYIDLCKRYQEDYGTEYSVDLQGKSELLSKIENAFYNVGIPVFEQPMVNACISIGDNNRIKNSTINVVVRERDDR